MAGTHNLLLPCVKFAMLRKYHPFAPPSPVAYTGHNIIIPHMALANVIRKQRRTYRRNIYESNPPELRTVDHDAFITPGTQPKRRWVLITVLPLAQKTEGKYRRNNS